MLGPALSLSRKTRRQKISHITIGSVNLREEKKEHSSRVRVGSVLLPPVYMLVSAPLYPSPFTSHATDIRPRRVFNMHESAISTDECEAFCRATAHFFPSSSKWKERFERTRQRKQYENGVVAVKRHTR